MTTYVTITVATPESPEVVAAIDAEFPIDSVYAGEREAPDNPIPVNLFGTMTAVPQVDLEARFRKLNVEVELGFSPELAAREVQRCLNCDAQTVFEEVKCIECDACVDICPTDCLTFTPNAEEPALREQLTMPARNAEQPLYVSAELPTQRVLVKDENVCLHCGLCAERCPTAAWDMQKFLYNVTQAGKGS